MPVPKPVVKAPAAKAMPKTTDHPPKPVGWFLVNSTVAVAEVYDVADQPAAPMLPPPPTRNEAGYRAYAAAMHRQHQQE